MSTIPVTTTVEPMRGEEHRPGRESARWLHVVSHTDPRYGGLSAAVPALAAELNHQAGLQVTLAAFCQQGEHVQPGVLSPEQVTFWPASRKEWVLGQQQKRRFRDLVEAADALHIHGLWEESTAVACRTARQRSKPYVLSAHGMLESWALHAKRLKKRVYAALIERSNVNGAACLHALTAAEAQQYRDFGAKGPIAIVPNAVDLPVSATPQLFLTLFPRLAGKRIVLFLSRLHAKKGLDLLLESWSRVSPEFRETHLVIAGPDTDGVQAQLARRVHDGRLDETVTFAGMLAGANKWSALAAADLYVLPSYSEGLSMALLEAMGMGLPVIATRACNMPQITIADAGWEIEPTVDDLSAALREALSSPVRSNQARGQRGARLIASEYNTRHVTEQMAEVYRYVLSGTRENGTPLWDGGAR